MDFKTSKDLNILLEGQSEKLVQTVKDSETVKQKLGVIEQIDGQIDSSDTVTFDLTISAVEVDDAFLSIEDNLCHGDEYLKVPFISEIPSCEVREGENTLFTLEVQISNDEEFLDTVYERFNNWDPLYYGKPRGKLVKFVKRI